MQKKHFLQRSQGRANNRVRAVHMWACEKNLHTHTPKNESLHLWIYLMHLALESYLKKLNAVESIQTTGWRQSKSQQNFNGRKLQAEILILESQPCIHKLDGWVPNKQEALSTGRAGVGPDGGVGLLWAEGRPSLTSTPHRRTVYQKNWQRLTASPPFLPNYWDH